jgi:hypothetical protein
MSRNFDQDADEKIGKQYKTRAVGQLYVGPLAAKGYDNRVMEVTVQEMEFQNSMTAERYMDQMRRKYSNKKGLIGARRLKTASISSDN